MIPSISQSHKQIDKLFIFFHTFNSISSLVVWGYFQILLLRESNNSVWVVVINHFAIAIGIQIGFTLATKYLHLMGYLMMYRLANILLAIISLMILMYLPYVAQMHIAIGLMAGLAMGIFWETNHALALGEMSPKRRSAAVSVNFSILDTLGIILPVIVGALIALAGYQVVFALGTMIYLIAAFYPWRENPRPHDKFKLSDVRAVVKRRGFGLWAAAVAVESYLAGLRGLVLGVLPFLLIGEEFGVGLLASAVGLVGAVFVFRHRRDDLRHKVHLGYIGSGIVFILNVFLLLFWTLPVLVVRLLVTKIGFSLFNPAYESLAYYNKQLVLGDFLREDGIEVTYVAETILFVCKLLAGLTFVVLFWLLKQDQMAALQVMFALTLLREPLVLYFYNWTSEYLKK